MPIKKMQDLELTGKTVVIREDLNVPMKDGKVTNDKRIRASLPTIRTALEKGAGVVLLSEPLTLQLVLALAGVALGIVLVNRRPGGAKP